MGRGQLTSRECITRLRDATREYNRKNETSLTVKRLPRRGKGSHEIWAVYDGETIKARGGVTEKMGDTVRDAFILAFERVFGKDWF